MVVATKFLPRTPEEIEKGISGQQHIENMINMSLKNLGMDHVDLGCVISIIPFDIIRYSGSVLFPDPCADQASVIPFP